MIIKWTTSNFNIILGSKLQYSGTQFQESLQITVGFYYIPGSSGCGLSALSLSGCSVQDTDLKPLVDALRAGLPLHMLKLSANRITDIGVTSLVESLTSSKTQPLAVLDLSNNQVIESTLSVI